MGELLLGGLIGFLIGAPLGALFRPPLARLEKAARRVWRQPAVKVHVERDPTIIWADAPDWVGFSLYFRHPLTLPAAPAQRDSWLAWGRQVGGVDAYMTMLSVTLQADAPTSVVIEELRVLHSARPVTDGLVLIRGVGGADLTPRRVHVELDSPDGPGVAFHGPGGAREPAPKFVLGPGDIERFHIWAEARTGWHEWTVDLLLLVDGRREVVTIDDFGGPFVTVGGDGLPQRMNLAGTSEWAVWPDGA